MSISTKVQGVLSSKTQVLVCQSKYYSLLSSLHTAPASWKAKTEGECMLMVLHHFLVHEQIPHLLILTRIDECGILYVIPLELVQS